jgi:hypothetical protein
LASSCPTDPNIRTGIVFHADAEDRRINAINRPKLIHADTSLVTYNMMEKLVIEHSKDPTRRKLLLN